MTRQISRPPGLSRKVRREVEREDRNALPREVRDEVKRWARARGESVWEMLKDLPLKFLADFFWHGGDPVSLLNLLNDYCNTPSSELRKPAPTLSDRQMLSLSNRLARDAKDVRSSGILSGQPGLFPTLARDLDMASQLLKQDYEGWTRAEMSRGAIVSYLDAAAKMVEVIMGTSHYEGLAGLVSALGLVDKEKSTGLHSSTNSVRPRSANDATLRINIANFRNRPDYSDFSFPDEVITARIEQGRMRWSALRANLNNS